MELEDLCVWPNGDWCLGEDLEQTLMSKSDDYTVVAYDSWTAAWHQGMLEVGCETLFGHEHWQVLNEGKLEELRVHLGISAPAPKVRCDTCNSPLAAGGDCPACYY